MRAYLAALKSARGPRYFWSVRKLWGLLCQYPDTDVVAAVARAMDHRIFDIRRVETILLQSIAETDFQLPLGFDPRGCPESADYQRGAVTPNPTSTTISRIPHRRARCSMIFRLCWKR